MTTLVIINIAIELFCSVLCFIFILCILVGDNLKIRLNRVFITVLLSNIVLMLSDALAFYSIGRTEPPFFVLNFIGNFCTFQFSYVIIMCFSNYINQYLATKIPIKRTLVYLAYGVCGFAILMTFLSLLNNMYFIIDENNIYHRQNMYWLSQVLGMIGMLINAVVIIQNRRHFNRMETFALASYIVLPVIAIVIQMSVYGYVSVYIASTTTIVLIYVGMQAQFSKMLKEKEVQLMEGRIDIMLSQIQPHFLYNALNTIDDLYYDSPDKGHESMLAFSDYLRGNMDALSQRKLIPFQTELEHTKQYLLLEKLRFEERLKIIYEIEKDNFMLPALTLQPIVENAVRHGITKQSAGGAITIKTEETEACFRIAVIDNGVGFNPLTIPNDGHTHIGIVNVRNRLLTMCGGSLKIESEPGGGTAVIIEIPKGKEPQI